MVYIIEGMYEIDLEPEVEDWLGALPYGHYQRVMRNADDYLVTGGVPDGDHVKKLETRRTGNYSAHRLSKNA